MAALHIARRYLVSYRHSRFMSLISVLSIVGIAKGVAAMICVLSVINGFETELRNRFLAANAHILAFQYPYGIDSVDKWTKKITDDFGKDVSGVSPFIHSETMITSGSLMHNILVRGIDPEKRKSVQEVTEFITPREALDTLNSRLSLPANQLSEPPPIILGSGLASILSVKIGDEVKLIQPDSQTDGQLRTYKLIGTYDSGFKHYDNKLGILAIPDAQKLFNMGPRVHGLEIGLKKPNDSRAIADRMSEKFTLTVREWQSFNKQMFEAMEMERSVIALIVALVAFVASFNILTTLIITVTQKQKSISILKALGASHGMILRIFILQGLLIGVIGAVCGVILAYNISWVLKKYQIVELPDLYMLTKLPIDNDPRVYALMAAIGVLMCVIAGIYPAWLASRTPIVDGFRGRA
jgi:lipoprotein-releasing system permease protein